MLCGQDLIPMSLSSTGIYRSGLALTPHPDAAGHANLYRLTTLRTGDFQDERLLHRPFYETRDYGIYIVQPLIQHIKTLD